MYHIFFIHSSVDGHLHCFHVLAIINSAAVNNGVHAYFHAVFFSEYIPRSEIIKSYDRVIGLSLKANYLAARVLP